MRRPGPSARRVDDAGGCAEAELGLRHPRVLNEVAREKLTAGDPSGAYQVLTEAVKDEPSNPSLWLNLAAALRGLDRHDEEMGALQRVLAIEPRNLRALLQKASLLELQNKPRAAAAVYRTALQSLSPGTRTPEWMAQVLAHAREAVDANNRSARGVPRGAVDDPASAPRRSAAAPIRSVPRDAGAEGADLPAATFVHVLSLPAGHRVLRAQRFPLARLDRGRDRRYS